MIYEQAIFPLTRRGMVTDDPPETYGIFLLNLAQSTACKAQLDKFILAGHYAVQAVQVGSYTYHLYIGKIKYPSIKINQACLPILPHANHPFRS
jgi:hypothetical protein